MRPVPAIRQEVLYGQRIVRCFADRPPTIGQMFQDAATANGRRTAIVAGDRRVSYAELARNVDCVASNLMRSGFGKGERIALLMDNEVEFVVSFLAVAKAGLISVPLNTRQREPEIAFAINQCRASALIADASYLRNVPDASRIPSVRSLFVAGGEEAGAAHPFAKLMADNGYVEPPAIDQEDTVCILYTSGTTGQPKGAMLTHVSTIHSVLHYAWAFDLSNRDVSFLSVPASHVTGLVAILLATIHAGGTTVILRNFKARHFLQEASRERITYSLMVPAMYNLCLLEPDFGSFDLASWRIAAFGGAPMPPATIERLRETLPELGLYNVYGSTETCSPVTILPAADIAVNPDSVGKPLPLADVVIVDENGREVAPGERGEMLVGGPMVVPGYWDNDDATAKSFLGGYWMSGDIGCEDADRYVRLFDRRKDMINRGGFKIYSVEVENVLAQHPAIVEAAVVGYPDPVLGERVAAFVVIDGKPLGEEDVRMFCSERLSDYKVPEMVELLNAPLPRNANGKVSKVNLRNLLAGTNLPGLSS